MPLLSEMFSAPIVVNVNSDARQSAMPANFGAPHGRLKIEEPNVTPEPPRTRRIKRPTGEREYIPSMRECVVARPRHLLGSIDYEAGELITHSQSCIWITGDSQLARALLEKIKPHNALAATILGLSYEEFQRRLEDAIHKRTCKDTRQAAKPANFGFPGGMGAPKLVLQQRKQGPDTPHPSGPQWIKDESTGQMVRGYKGLRFCLLMDNAPACGVEKVRQWNDRPIPPTCLACIRCAQRLKQLWQEQWPENRAYFQHINRVVADGEVITPEMLARWPHLAEVFAPWQRLGPGEIMQHHSGRIRGGVQYCDAANGYFQGLLADAAKSALRRMVRECYDRTARVPRVARWNSVPSLFGGGPSPLYGSRVIVFQHDEVIPEFPESVASEGVTRVSEIMEEELRYYCPDLAPVVRAPPALMARWDKRAEPVIHGDRVVAWTAEHSPKKCGACTEQHALDQARGRDYRGIAL